ncbi:hypothetical protein ABZX34_10805 [Streptomyces sp. NPDC004362]|uniref:phosphotriesterase family protein n=1 Tax=Streptomyces sp. NPDC004362 TaxID=3154456 RepID=UPI00339F41E8
MSGLRLSARTVRRGERRRGPGAREWTPYRRPAGTSARPRRQNAAASRPPLARITPTPSGEPQEIGAIEDTLTPGVERVMRAVAQAHLRTGAPITVPCCT